MTLSLAEPAAVNLTELQAGVAKEVMSMDDVEDFMSLGDAPGKKKEGNSSRLFSDVPWSSSSDLECRQNP
jgi:hypothetical protein